MTRTLGVGVARRTCNNRLVLSCPSYIVPVILSQLYCSSILVPVLLSWSSCPSPSETSWIRNCFPVLQPRLSSPSLFIGIFRDSILVPVFLTRCNFVSLFVLLKLLLFQLSSPSPYISILLSQSSCVLPPFPVLCDLYHSE